MFALQKNINQVTRLLTTMMVILQKELMLLQVLILLDFQ